MKIKTKLMLGLGIIFLLTLFMGIYTLYLENEIVLASDYQEHMSIPATNLLFQIEAKYFAMEAYANEYLNGWEEGKEEYEHSKTELYSLINNYDELTYVKRSDGNYFANPMMQKQMQDYVIQFQNSANKFSVLFDELINYNGEKNSDEYFQLFEKIENEEDLFLETLSQDISMEMAGSKDQSLLIHQLESEAIIIQTIFGIILSFTIIGVLIILIRSIANPLEKLKIAIDEVSKGNLDLKIESKGGDELESLASDFENMREKIKSRRALLEKEIVTRNLELEIANQELKQIDKMKDEFVAMISHELKTPLMPIVGWCEMLREPKMMGELSQEQLDAVNSIHTNTVNLKGMIEDILEVHRLEIKKIQFYKKDFNVNELLEQVINQFKFHAKLKKIKLVNLSPNDCILYSDRFRISQVLSNLVRNAIDFVPKGTGRIELNAKIVDNSMVFSVKDNGIGINFNKQKDLFKKFFQIDASDTRTHLGSGLGLAVCKGIIEGLKGKIWVVSSTGKGATFLFKIPTKEKVVILDKEMKIPFQENFD